MYKRGITDNLILKMQNNSNNPNIEIIVHLDASGKLIRPPNTPSITKKVVLNYALIIPIKVCENEPSDPYSLTEMISSSHSFETIGNYLHFHFSF